MNFQFASVFFSMNKIAKLRFSDLNKHECHFSLAVYYFEHDEVWVRQCKLPGHSVRNSLTMSEDFSSSQPSYLQLLLDKSDPDEQWDCAFTSTQFCQAVYPVEAEQKEIAGMWMNEVTDQELLSIAMDQGQIIS